MASASVSSKVQHVAKASSDELLRKFADSETGKASPRKIQRLLRGPVARRKRRPSRRMPCHSAGDCSIYCAEVGVERTAEWKGLLRQNPPPHRSAVLLRRIIVAAGISDKLRAGEIPRVDFFLAALEKTWRKMVEGASRLAVERHCSRHVRLISDMV
ncbi:unnamed protein product [Spirodela intermedia]|uniref:Uncharacterized protein n=1 Tax=Spirodela intermedia TaxID=51605 RepID=A0A7I8K137_SPIIN|nr:unnamed protein product [Spirodela intermedia]